MKDSGYLIFTKRGLLRLVKGRRASYGPRTRPALGAGEYAVYISVTVPDAAFQPQPVPEATLTIPESALITPPVVVTLDTEPPIDG